MRDGLHCHIPLIYDLQGRDFNALPGKLVRSEGQKRINDPAVNEAYDHQIVISANRPSLIARRS